MTETSNTSKHTVVAPWKDRLRFPIKGKRTNQWKPGKRRGATLGPTVCGAPHPDRGATVLNDDGTVKRSAIVCMAHAGFDITGRPIVHAGKHRARIAPGVVLRWTEDE